MQTIFLDVTAEQLAHNAVLQSCIQPLDEAAIGNGRYVRVCLQEQSADAMKQKLAQMMIEESVHWTMQKERAKLLRLCEAQDVELLKRRIQSRIAQIQPQLELLVYHDMERRQSCHTHHAAPCWNMEGYLQFSAKKLKWAVQTVLQEEYQAYKEELEREEFISLLQFCVAVQPCLLDDVYLTLRADQFTMVDIWGNDLQQIYLDALPEEEYAGAQMHDLILSILMTMLPKNIHLFVESEQMTAKQKEEQQKLVQLLQQIFMERLWIEQTI